MTAPEPRFVDAVETIVRTRSGVFSVDQLEDEISIADLPPNSIGPCMKALAASGVIQVAGYRKSTKPSRRGSYVLAWRVVTEGRAA